MKNQSKEHTPHRKTRTWRKTRAYCYLSCDIFDQDDKALGYVEVDQSGLDVYPKHAKKPSRRLDWSAAFQKLLAVVMIAASLVMMGCAGNMAWTKPGTVETD
jgi:hypothetical protein